MANWLKNGKNTNPQRRNLVLSGVSSGREIEIIGSLKTFLTSFGVSDSLFDIKATEPTDNKRVSSFFKLNDTIGYSKKINDIVVFNPYQTRFTPVPVESPSFREIYRSTREWTFPRWSGLQWIRFYIFDHRNSSINYNNYRRFAGYDAFLVLQKSEMPPLAALKYPKCKVVPLNIFLNLPSGTTHMVEVLIVNTGIETWPAIGLLKRSY